jgi:hypothetical protein
MITVCCFLWYDPHGVRNNVYVYDDRHVNALKTMVERNLNMEHEFICVSDREVAGVKCIPLDTTSHVPGTRYAKLMMYNPQGALAGKRILYLDLDAIITRDITPLASRDEDLVLWRNPNFGEPRRARYNTSIILHTVGTRPEFWNDFNKETTPQFLWRMWGGTDQAWISHRASKNEAHWTDADGVYGAGRLIKASGNLDGVGTTLPDNARVVFTPGEREPSMPHMIETHPWIADHYPLWQEAA